MLDSTFPKTTPDGAYDNMSDRSMLSTRGENSDRPSTSSMSGSSIANSYKARPWAEQWGHPQRFNFNGPVSDPDDPFDSVSPNGSLSIQSYTGSRKTSSSAVDSGYHGNWSGTGGHIGHNNSCNGGPVSVASGGGGSSFSDESVLASVSTKSAPSHVRGRHHRRRALQKDSPKATVTSVASAAVLANGGCQPTVGTDGNRKSSSNVFYSIRASFIKFFDPKGKKKPLSVPVGGANQTTPTPQTSDQQISLNSHHHSSMPLTHSVDVTDFRDGDVTYPGSYYRRTSSTDNSIVVDNNAFSFSAHNGCTRFSVSMCSQSASSLHGSRTSLNTTLSTEEGNSEQLCSSPCADHYPLDQLSPLPTSQSNRSKIKGGVWQAQIDYDLLHRRNPRLSGKQQLFNRSGSVHLGPAHSCPAKSGRIVRETFPASKEILCQSWPPSGKRIFPPDTEEEFVQEEDIIIDHIRVGCESVYEFNIPFKDIKLGECIKDGKRRKIYKGQWHGEVMVHAYHNLNQPERSKFWEEVSKLSMIRHENIALFMGACMEPPNFAVVTSVRKGISLYEKIHVSREKTHQSFKLSVMRQVTQAVGYLHARNKPIVVRRLNSKNIFIEPKIVLCLLDYSHNDEEEDTPGLLEMTNHLLPYYAPELLRIAGDTTPRTIPENNFSKETDAYAFGTIMYELHMNRLPFNKSSSIILIEDVCSGKREDVKDLRCSDTVKSLIRNCWSNEPQKRPDFASISKELMQRYAAHKRHSSSEPENLQRITEGGFLYGY